MCAQLFLFFFLQNLKLKNQKIQSNLTKSKNSIKFNKFNKISKKFNKQWDLPKIEMIK